MPEEMQSAGNSPGQNTRTPQTSNPLTRPGFANREEAMRFDTTQSAVSPGATTTTTGKVLRDAEQYGVRTDTAATGMRPKSNGGAIGIIFLLGLLYWATKK